MSDFKAKIYQIQFRLTPLGSLQRSPDPLAGLRGPTSKGREGTARGGEGGEVELRGRGQDPTPSRPLPNPYFWICPCLWMDTNGQSSSSPELGVEEHLSRWTAVQVLSCLLAQRARLRLSTVINYHLVVILLTVIMRHNLSTLHYSCTYCLASLYHIVTAASCVYVVVDDNSQQRV